MPYFVDTRPPSAPATELDLSQPNTSRAGRTTAGSGATISSLLLSHFTSSSSCTADPAPARRKGGAFSRGLGGCTAGAAREVSVPAAIRSSAEWEDGRPARKSKKKGAGKRKGGVALEAAAAAAEEGPAAGNCMASQDVWCGPGIGLSAAGAMVGPVERDCVVPRRTGRGKIDGERLNLRERERERERERDRERERGRDRERSYCFARRAAVNSDILSFWDTDSSFVTSRPEPELFGSSYRRHVRHASPDGLAEMMMLHGSFMMGGRSDRFRDLRLDIDHMSYEQLVDLGDRIGHVSTGLKENEISKCIRKLKHSVISSQSAHLALLKEKKCSICQEEYEVDDDLGKLDCGHGFHVQCLKQWLAHKNSCPICKTPPVGRG